MDGGWCFRHPPLHRIRDVRKRDAYTQKNLRPHHALLDDGRPDTDCVYNDKISMMCTSITICMVVVGDDVFYIIME